MLNIISRTKAKELGLKRYFTGEPCKYGHVSERLIINCVCITCQYNLTNRLRKENSDKYKQQNRRYRQKEYLFNRNDILNRNLEWRIANNDKFKLSKKKYRENNVEKNREWQRIWYQENYDRVIVNVMLRQENVGIATPKWINHLDLYQVYRNRLDGYHVDHIVPIKGITPEGYKVSGLNVPWNLQYLTALENHSKKNKMTQRCYEIACSLRKEIE